MLLGVGLALVGGYATLRRRAAFDEAANLPFTEDELTGEARQRKEGKAS